MSAVPDIPAELDLSAAHGFVMQGWDFSAAQVREAVAVHRLLNPALELGTNICPWNCSFCFTEGPENPEGRKRRLAHELSLERRLALIDEVADLGARSINFVGAGEPTSDPDFWMLVERIAARGVSPIIYTEGSLKLGDPVFARRLFDLGATVVLKVNSLSDAAYQDSIVRGTGREDRTPGLSEPTRPSYTARRNHALDVLLECGFASSVPTRLAFDTIICRQNVGEIETIHRFARERNIFVLFVNYLPSGRTHEPHFDAISLAEQLQIFARLAEIDAQEFALRHRAIFPYAGGVPCTIRGLGLFVKVQGQVFDCPGESIALGDLRNEPLAAIWQRARPISETFDGGCLPRRQFWDRWGAGHGGVSLPVLPAVPTR